MNHGLALIRSGQLLYADDVGKDACGIGGVAAKDGKPTAEVVRKALTALKARLEEGRNTQLLIAEVPLFYESAGEFPADLVIVVATEGTMQQQRLTGPRNLDPDTAGRIRSAQWPLSRKLEPADIVVWNEGSLPLLSLQARILVQ